MERAIWKFELGMTDEEQEIEMPVGAQIVSAAFQGTHPCLWAICGIGNATEARRFVIVGTGWTGKAEWWNRLQHIATLHQNGFVWHLFEVVA